MLTVAAESGMLEDPLGLKLTITPFDQKLAIALTTASGKTPVPEETMAAATARPIRRRGIRVIRLYDCGWLI